jgi:valyl-tRNA synthetase
MSEGTGAVHTAPGHGEEDFEVGTKYGLPAFSPVDPSGRFTKEAGKYAGLSVRDANRVIIEDLKAKNLLWKEETIVPSLLAVQNSPHPSSNRPMVCQSHFHQEENAEREPEGAMGARMGRVQEVPRLA